MTPAAQPIPNGAREAHRARIRTRLLDSAEELFADRGYFGVSVRDITDHAGCRVAAISDSFGGKENLFREVLLRRIRPINNDRRGRLAALPRSGPRKQRLRGLIEAFVHPMLDRADAGPGWRHYFRFIAQLANSGQPIQLLVANEFDTIAGEFIDHLRTLFPRADDTAVLDAYLYMLAATLQAFADNRRLDSITSGRLHTSDVAQRSRTLIPFLEGGITHLATTDRPADLELPQRHIRTGGRPRS